MTKDRLEMKLMTDNGRLACYAFPLSIPLNPGIGKTTGEHNPFAFLFHLILIYSRGNSDILIQMNLDSPVAQWLIMSLSVSNISQQLTLVHEFSVIISEIKGLR